MLEKLRTLVPFVGKEVKAKKENLQLEFVKKVIELVSTRGFHYLNLNDNSEWYAVWTRDEAERFEASLYYSKYYSNGLGSYITEYQSKLLHLRQDGSRDLLSISVGRLVKSEALVFTAEQVDASSQKTPLSKKEWTKLIRSFLASKVDYLSTAKAFAEFSRDEEEYIERNEVILEWITPEGSQAIREAVKQLTDKIQ